MGYILKAENIRTVLRTLWMVMEMILWRDVPDERIFWLGSSFLDIFLNISRRMKVSGTSNIPSTGKAIFVSNHISISDPIYITTAIYWGTGGKRRCASLMRNDFFRISFINRRMKRYLLTPLFPRDSMKKGRLTTVIGEIHENFDRGIVIFTSGTRSKNGEILYVYSDNKKGKVGISSSRRKDPGRLIKIVLRDFKETAQIVPTTITYNYINNDIGVVFGSPVVFEGQRDDHMSLNKKVDEVIRKIENQVYVGLHHLLPVILERYTRSGPPFIERDGTISISQIREDLRALVDSMKEVYPYLEEKIVRDFQGELENTIAFFIGHNMIERSNSERIRLIEDRIHSVPELNTRFKKRNPFLFYINQVKGVKVIEELISRIPLRKS